jgi:uncharacterized protein (TIGR03437 family)
VNQINWLANFNLAASNRFGLPVCSGASIDLKTCVNPSGSMSYQAAALWVKAMNAANYLGHSNWQLPTNALVDTTCPLVGPNGGSFGFNCTGSALGSLYYAALGMRASTTAVPIPNNTVGSFTNFQPYIYWSSASTNQTFSFDSGYVGSNTETNFLYVLPMIPGKISGAPAGQTVYEPTANVTWLANANIAATNPFGLPPCKTFNSPKQCVGADGAMNIASANQLVANMNAAEYLGQTHWELPPLDNTTCSEFNCNGSANPMGALYYNLLGLTQGTPVVAVPDIAVGPFTNIQPYLYWACQALTIQDACQPINDGPATGFEWSFSFGNGFEGTDIFVNDLYATAYFVGPPSTTSGIEISEVANAEGESPVIAPNTWVEIKGVNLSPAGDSRIWQNSDFVNGQLPTALDGVSATVNGKPAFIYYIRPTQVNILTPPDAMSGPVQVQITNNGATASAFTAQAQSLSPSFFVFAGGDYVAATHLSGSYLGPAAIYPGLTIPAQPGETVVLYANGFGAQSGSLSPLPLIQIGGVTAIVQFAGLVAPGQFQFNVTIPATLSSGDQPIVATYNGQSTQPGTLITIQN